MPIKDPEKRRAYRRQHWERNKARLIAENRAWRLANKEKSNANSRAWQLRNPDRVRERRRLYDIKTKESRSEQARASAAANPELHRARRRAAALRYKYKNLEAVRDKARKSRRANPAQNAANQRKRHAQKMMACPSWANVFLIREIYELASLRTRVVGKKFEVDHIVPLRSPEVCGLHVEHNLRVIPATANREKKNKQTFIGNERSDQWAIY